MGTDNIKRNRICMIFVISIVLVLMLRFSYAAYPSAPTGYDNVSSSQPEPTIGMQFNTSGGTISTVNFNVTTQNPRWKGFVGNITGKFALQDSDGASLYDWSLINVQGEIYATRNNTLVDWDNVGCADYEDIANEQEGLGFEITDEDSINKTFNMTQHDEFYAGNTFISQDSCYSTYLNVGGEKQYDSFQELLLQDENIIYTGLLENSAQGFRGEEYDYQIIVPDNTDSSKPDETYYLYIELI